jgi:hypothetical protein
LDEKTSSPLGLLVGGRVLNGLDTLGLLTLSRFGGGDDGAVASWGRGKKKFKGSQPAQANFERRGGRRTLRTMLKERRARLAWGTYLGEEEAWRVRMGDG